MKDDWDQQLTATAYHEAGHAVMAMILGRLVQKVTIAAGKSSIGQTRLGLCEMKQGRSRASKNRLEDEVLIHFAGMVAEARFTGHYCQRGAQQDLQAIKRLLCDRAGSPSRYERLQRRLLSKTEHLLYDPQHALAIKMIADELLLKTTISGRAVTHLFQQATK